MLIIIKKNSLRYLIIFYSINYQCFYDGFEIMIFFKFVFKDENAEIN